MASQNFVSASITPEAQDAITKLIAEVRSRLGFLLNLQTSEVATMVKAGKELIPFLAECRKVVKAHPEIFTGSFDAQEFERDFLLAEALGLILDQLDELTEAVRHTLIAVRGDLLVAAFDVYAATRLHRDKIPGLNVMAENLGVYFKRNPRSAKAAP